jgi:hypothetical protein
MALLTLTDHWSAEKTQRQTALTKLSGQLTTARSDLTAARAALLAAGAAERQQADQIDALRRQLAAIPMPADGDPLLLAMNVALVARAQARVAQVEASLAKQVLTAQVAHLENLQQSASAALASAQASLDSATLRATALQTLKDRFTSGDLANLVTEADQALSDFETGANDKLKAGFPANSGDDSRDLLTRIRDRRTLVQASADLAAGVLEHAAQIADDPVKHARAAYEAASNALASASCAAPRLAVARASLERLSKLTTPLLTPDQAAALNDAAQQSDREDALAKLCAVDVAEAERGKKQAAYEQALADQRKTDPDTPESDLDSGALKTSFDEREAANTALVASRSALSSVRPAPDTPSDRERLDAWFAAVPDSWWDALETLDSAVATLKSLQSPTPTDLLSHLDDQEDLLVKALQAAELLARQQDAQQNQRAQAAGSLAAELDTAPQRARAMSRSAGVF